MAIHTRWGNTVKVLRYAGEVHVRNGLTLHLIRARITSRDGSETSDHYRFLEYLKADDGWQEIHQAAATAPRMELKGEALKFAIRDAQ